MARRSSDDRHHRHKHKHKHGSHHHKKHKKKRKKHRRREGSSDGEERRKGEGETPEVRMDERELQAVLETLEEGLIEQCVRSDSSAEEASDAPPPTSPPRILTPHQKQNEGEPLNPQSLNQHSKPQNTLKPGADTDSSTETKETVTAVSDTVEGAVKQLVESHRAEGSSCVTRDTRSSQTVEDGRERHQLTTAVTTDVCVVGRRESGEECALRERVEREGGCIPAPRSVESREVATELVTAAQNEALQRNISLHKSEGETASESATSATEIHRERGADYKGKSATEIHRERGADHEDNSSTHTHRERDTDYEKRSATHTHRKRGADHEDNSSTHTHRERDTDYKGKSATEIHRERGAGHEERVASESAAVEVECGGAVGDRLEEGGDKVKEGGGDGVREGGSNSVKEGGSDKVKEGGVEDVKDGGGADVKEGGSDKVKEGGSDKVKGGDGGEGQRRNERKRKYSGSSGYKKKRKRDRERDSHSHSPSPSRKHSPSPSRSRRHRSRSRSRSSRSPHRSEIRRHYSSSSRGVSRRQGRRSRSPYHSRRDSQSWRRYRGNRRRDSSRHRRSRSRSQSRSRSRERRRRRRRRSHSSRSRSISRSPERGRGEEEKEEEEGGAAIGFMGQLQVEAVIKEMAAKVKQVHINQFTSLCKNLQKRQEWEDRGGGIYDDLMPEPEVRAPFKLAEAPAYRSGLVLHNNVWKTPNQLVTESNAKQAERPVVEKFPVSCGIEHQQQENTLGPSSSDQGDDLNVFSGTKV